MRELKFRAFIKGKNIIRPVAYLKFSDDNELMMVGVFNNNHEISEFIPEDVIIDQSTGFKDKNGKKIFEGDILIYKFPYDKRTKTKSIVVWREDKACFGLKDLNNLTTEEVELYRLSAENYLEIVANIHQNQELLEDK